MDNTVKASNVADQLKIVRMNRNTTDHRFFNVIAMAVKAKLEEQIPGLELHFGGKTISGSQVSAQLTGQIIDEEGDIGDKIRQVMDGLKNPAMLMSLLK